MVRVRLQEGRRLRSPPTPTSTSRTSRLRSLLAAASNLRFAMARGKRAPWQRTAADRLRRITRTERPRSPTGSAYSALRGSELLQQLMGDDVSPYLAIEEGLDDMGLELTLDLETDAESGSPPSSPEYRASIPLPSSPPATQQRLFPRFEIFD